MRVQRGVCEDGGQVNLQAVIAGRTFERTVNVDILPRATTVSPLSGPRWLPKARRSPIPTARPMRRAAWSSITGVRPARGHDSSVGGSSITCRFHEVSATTTTNVSVTVSASGGNDSSELLVTVVPDMAPPTLTLPSLAPVGSTSHIGAIVSYVVSAHDLVSGHAAVSCAPNSGTQFPIGSTTVSCTASDWQGNLAKGSFSVGVNDATIPTLMLPGPSRSMPRALRRRRHVHRDGNRRGAGESGGLVSAGVGIDIRHWHDRSGLPGL